MVRGFAQAHSPHRPERQAAGGGARVVGHAFARYKSFKNPRDRHVEIAQTRPPWLVEGPHGHSRMPLKKCQWYGCHNDDLTEITAAEEDFCKCLVAAQFGWRDFKRRPDSGTSAISGKMFKAKTWLCDEHLPEGLANADLLLS
jgi:hypothetical protein